MVVQTGGGGKGSVVPQGWGGGLMGYHHFATVPRGVAADRLPWGGTRGGGGMVEFYITFAISNFVALKTLFFDRFPSLYPPPLRSPRSFCVFLSSPDIIVIFTPHAEGAP